MCIEYSTIQEKQKNTVRAHGTRVCHFVFKLFIFGLLTLWSSEIIRQTRAMIVFYNPGNVIITSWQVRVFEIYCKIYWKKMHIFKTPNSLSREKTVLLLLPIDEVFRVQLAEYHLKLPSDIHSQLPVSINFQLLRMICYKFNRI